MRRASPLLLLAVTLLTGGLLAVAVAAVGCGPNTSVFWVCLNPVTGKDDGSIYDSTNFHDGVADPCHCYDACGPSKECPIVVDAGPLPPGCDGGADGAGGSDGG